ncbi:MAG TPA: hypothetical protein VN579_01975 [Bryobacteraceae bacterium]|nr:hypothetical protein [Bryobacteraceae bacterium]
MQRSISAILSFAALVACIPAASAAVKKESRSVYLGTVRHVPYTQQGDPAGAVAGEDSLPIRALLVNGGLKEWTTGDAHDVTDRSFVVRRAIRLNNSLPGDKKQQWVWQRGPWLLVDRATGRISALKLPDYDPAVSRVAWFRDYAAYCGLTSTGKSLYAVVAQLTVRRPALAKKLAAYDPASRVSPACAPAEWQRDPMRITFHPAGRDAVTYDFVPGSAVLVEDDGEESQTPGDTPAGTARTQTQP